MQNNKELCINYLDKIKAILNNECKNVFNKGIPEYKIKEILNYVEREAINYINCETRSCSFDDKITEIVNYINNEVDLFIYLKNKEDNKEKEKENKTMAKVSEVLDKSLETLAKPGLRIVGRNVTDVVNTATSKVLGLSNNRLVGSVRAFLETEQGKATLASGLSLFLTKAPLLKNNDKVQKLAEEIKNESLAIAGQALIDKVAILTGLKK
jgi:hypothetical protein